MFTLTKLVDELDIIEEKLEKDNKGKMYPIVKKIHLKIFGYYIDGNDKKIICYIHGLTDAVVHGYGSKISCLKCIEMEITGEFERWGDE